MITTILNLQGDTWRKLTDSQIDPDEASYMSKFFLVSLGYEYNMIIDDSTASLIVHRKITFLFLCSEKYRHFKEHALPGMVAFSGWV